MAKTPPVGALDGEGQGPHTGGQDFGLSTVMAYMPMLPLEGTAETVVIPALSKPVTTSLRCLPHTAGTWC